MNKALRRAVIAGNWKMNKTPAEAKELLSGEKIREGSQMILPAWGVKIIEE